MKGTAYMEVVAETLRRAWDTQTETIDQVTTLIADAIERKSNVFVFGCSHAGILAEEVFYRTGGLVTVNPIFFPGFMLNTRPITMTSKLERLPGLAKIIIDENHVKKDDVLLIHSVSGRNTVPVEMAEYCRKLGVHTVAITSLAYSQSVTSRAPSGKHLFEACDLVLDNCGVPGDAAMKLDGLPEAIGPTSTAVGAALMNGLVIESVEKLIARGIVPPVFMSANLDGGDAHNRKIFDEYADNIFYM